MKAEHIREIHFPTWLLNVVVVSKAGGKWWVRVDFKNLNKACLKDCYSLPRIDQLVDSIIGHELICMLNAYQRYHQILLTREDKTR